MAERRKSALSRVSLKEALSDSSASFDSSDSSVTISVIPPPDLSGQLDDRSVALRRDLLEKLKQWDAVEKEIAYEKIDLPQPTVEECLNSDPQFKAACDRFNERMEWYRTVEKKWKNRVVQKKVILAAKTDVIEELAEVTGAMAIDECEQMSNNFNQHNPSLDDDSAYHSNGEGNSNN